MSAPLHHDDAFAPPFDPEQALASLEFVALDTETTGLAWTDRLVELGAVRFRGSTVLDTFHTLVNPRRAIPSEVTELHGITDAMAAQAPVAREILPGFARFCHGALGLAHFADFDRRILATEFVRAGLVVPRFSVYCTVALSRTVWPELPRHGLQPLARHLGIAITQPHRALADAEIDRQLFLAALPHLGAVATRAGLDHAVGRYGHAPLRGVTRPLTELPRRWRNLGPALRDGTSVTVCTRTDAGAVCHREGIPEAAYTHHGAAMLDLREPSGAVVTVALDQVTRVL